MYHKPAHRVRAHLIPFLEHVVERVAAWIATTTDSRRVVEIRPPYESVRQYKPQSTPRCRYDEPAHNAFDLPEPSRIEREDYFNPAIRRPVDVEHEPGGGELDQVEPGVPGIAVRLVRL